MLHIETKYHLWSVLREGAARVSDTDHIPKDQINLLATTKPTFWRPCHPCALGVIEIAAECPLVAYVLPLEERTMDVWIITEADRSVTTFLRPDEY